MSELALGLGPGLPWILAVSAPLAVAALFLLPPAREAAATLAPLAPAPALVLALAGPPPAEVEWLLLGASFALDEPGRALLLLTALVWLLAGFYARGYLRGDPARGRFWVFTLCTLAGNLGVVVSADIPTFYFSFALMSYAGFGLVIHRGTRDARRAAVVYLAFTVFGELFLLAGLVPTAFAADAGAGAGAGAESGGWIASLLFVGFGVKAGALFLHMWLPVAHPAAPTPASAILSGAMIKAGVIGWSRFLPLGAAESAGVALVLLGLLGAFYAVAAGLPQRDPKTILAYSSVSQVGLITAATGAAIATAGDATAGAGVIALFALHHGLAKGSLFLGVGVAERRLSGAGRVLVAAGLLLPGLSLAGLPLTSGAVAKKGVEEALDRAGLGGALGPVLSLASAATLVLLLRFFTRMRAVHDGAAARSARPAPTMAAAFAIAVAASAAAVFLVPWIDAPRLARASLAPGSLLGALWPALLGLALYAGAAALGRRRGARLPAIPAGDLLDPLERAFAAARRSAGAVARTARTRTASAAGALSAASAAADRAARGLLAVEDRLGFPTAAALAILLAALLALLAALF